MVPLFLRLELKYSTNFKPMVCLCLHFENVYSNNNFVDTFSQFPGVFVYVAWKRAHEYSEKKEEDGPTHNYLSKNFSRSFDVLAVSEVMARAHCSHTNFFKNILTFQPQFEQVGSHVCAVVETKG